MIFVDRTITLEHCIELSFQPSHVSIKYWCILSTQCDIPLLMKSCNLNWETVYRMDVVKLLWVTLSLLGTNCRWEVLSLYTCISKGSWSKLESQNTGCCVGFFSFISLNQGYLSWRHHTPTIYIVGSFIESSVFEHRGGHRVVSISLTVALFLLGV